MPHADTTLIWIVAGAFLVVSVVAAMIWWSLADRLFPGADRATGQHVDVFEPDGSRRAGRQDAPVIISSTDTASPSHRGSPSHADDRHDGGHGRPDLDAPGGDAGPGGSGDGGGSDGGSGGGDGGGGGGGGD